MKKIIYLLITITLIIISTAVRAGSGSAPDSTFGYFTEITPPDPLFLTPPDEDFWVVATAPSDYDNDGDLDIAVLGFYVVYNISAEDRLVLMKNNGQAGPEEWDFEYVEVPLGTLTAGASDLSWGDMDGDGDYDLLLGSDDDAVIFRNDTGNLVLTSIQLPGYWEENSQAYFDLHSLSWADYDNDGDADILMPSVFDFNNFSFYTPLLRNDGSDSTGGWIFTNFDSIFTSTSHAQSIWADYDGDADLDLLLVNVAPLTEDGFIKRFRNDSSGSFFGENILGDLSIEHGEAQWGDYDDDGDLDILVAGNIREINGTYTPMALRIYRNDNEIYTPEEVIPDPYAQGWFDFTAATWADYDSDGDMDILLAGNYNSGTNIEGRARVYNNDNGIFTDSGSELPAPHASGDRGGTFSWLDIDGDGDLDYFIAGEYFVPGGNGLVEAQMHLYRNDTPLQNDAPLTPEGLSVTHVNSNTVLLSWQPGIDDHTPVAALTYDLNLFHEGAPMILPARTPEPGNARAVTEWTITGLEDGHYEWILRTVDASYTGSPLAVGEFTIGPLSSGKTPDQTGFTLFQNFPNPFTNVTYINYSITSEEWVSLEVYDGYGTKIAQLVDEKVPAGSHIVSFDAKAFSSGIYYYRLNAGNYTRTMKMSICR